MTSRQFGGYFGPLGEDTAFEGSFTAPGVNRIHYGPGSVSKLSQEIADLGVKRAFVITTPSIVRSTEHVSGVVGLLQDRHAGTFAESVQHVPRATVLHAAEAARRAGADCVVSLGGGSASDLAKAVVMCLAKDIREEADFDGLYFRQVDGHVVAPPITGDFMPHIAIPTTLSAAEFTQFMGITDSSRLAKDVYGAPGLAPRVVILDPEMALDTPASLWGGTGMRAVDHAVETLCSIAPEPFADALATRALEILSEALPRSIENPTDVAARGACQVAMWMAMYSFANVPMGMSHAIGHQLGPRCDIPHGVCSAIMLPVVLDYNREVNAERQAVVARALGVDTGGMSVLEAAGAASEALRSLVRSLQLNAKLSDWGVSRDDLLGVAEEAVNDVMIVSNPRPVKSVEAVLELLQEAY